MFNIYVTQGDRRHGSQHDCSVLEFGRMPRRDVPRVVLDDPRVSRNHLRVEDIGDGEVCIRNISRKSKVMLEHRGIVKPGEIRVVALPQRIFLGESFIDIQGDDEDSIADESLKTMLAPLGHSGKPQISTRLATRRQARWDNETLIRWFETVVSVQRAAAGSRQFYQEAADALVELVGLDIGLVLLFPGEVWEVVAQSGLESVRNATFSRRILKRITSQRRTFYHVLDISDSLASLAGVQAIVASPILDPQDHVIGALYGVSRRGRGSVGAVEAGVVQILAAAVGAGLARLERETAAARTRVQFEQFFSADLVAELERNPALLEGREQEVTVLFADLRHFSRISERIGARDTYSLLADVMDRLTEQVMARGGVIIDYYGDGISAMWNAPRRQPHHAADACQAAIAMQQEMQHLTETWRKRAGEVLCLGIGINTGQAIVGNSGSRRRLKYGPQGHVVNLTSRVEGATKQFGVPILVTGATHAKAGAEFETRRLCKLRAVGVSDAIDVYELYPSTPDSRWRAHRDTYERALALYESKRWTEALTQIAQLRLDQSCLPLMRRIRQCVESPPELFDPALELMLK